VGEQLLYEIGDPARYILPDVICDFTAVTLTQAGLHRVEVSGVKGYAPTTSYKVSATYADGYRSSAQLTIIGFDAERKARRTAAAILERTRDLFKRFGLADFSATHIEVLGAANSYGPHVKAAAQFEAVLWLAVTHSSKQALDIFAREIAPAGTSWAPGTTGAAGRPAVSIAIKQFAFLLDKQRVQASVTIAGASEPIQIPHGVATVSVSPPPTAEILLTEETDTVDVPLIELAYARSGDKGDTSNIGVLARRPDYLPVLRAQLTEAAVAAWLAHLVKGTITRYELPGIHAFNFVCEQALDGGGMASLRNDALGKGMAQVLLAMPVRVPKTLLSSTR
jgi:hypothetical protein